jgi:hypothetical protein
MQSIANVGAVGSSGASSFNDSISRLTGTGYQKNQTITATLFVAGSGGSTEVELHVRTSFNSTQIFTYEFDISFATNSVIIVKWKGDIGDITILPFTNGTDGTGLTLSNGDVFVAAITGDATLSTLTLKQNGTLIAQANDSTAISGIAPYVTGNPGIGGDDGNGQSNNVGWKNYSVVTS